MSDLSYMSDSELAMVYKYSMVNSYSSFNIRYINGTYHPKFEHNSMCVASNKQIFLYTHHSLTLLNEIWERYKVANFGKQCWWQSINVLNTKISYPIVKEEEEIITRINKKNKIRKYIIYNSLRHYYVSQGFSRKVYISPCKTYVIKVSNKTSNRGLEENKMEALTYSKSLNSIYASCELIENDWLKMEYVKIELLTKDDNLPDWTKEITDCQVGYNLEGKLVAYDYGS